MRTPFCKNRFILGLKEQLTQIFEPLLAQSFDRESGEKNLQRLLDSLEQRENQELQNLFSGLPASVYPELAALLSGSPYLFKIFLENLDYFLEEASNKGSLAYSLSRQGVEAAYKLQTRSIKGLKTFKDRQILRIGLADLTKKLETVKVIEELSDLASFCLEAVYQAGLDLLVKRYGQPFYETEIGEIQPCSFTVIGMGKLGGRELNFSSDIDIIFIYDPDIGKTEGVKNFAGKSSNQVSNFEFFSQLAVYISNTLHSNQIYRVDLGLRPEGKSGPAAISLVAAELYYESWGQSWERQALIKARPCAGDLNLGREFLKTLQPFIYRKSLDFSAIREIKKMKLLIDSQPQIKKSGIDLKLGKGGIRELEFIIQSFQLIYGGRNIELQDPGSLPALEEIAAKKLITPGEQALLKKAYLFLRDLENRVQMFQGRQTQTLPQNPKRLDALGRKMNLSPKVSSGESLMGQYRHHSGNVSRIFQQIFDRESEDNSPDNLEKPTAYRGEQFDFALEKVGFKDLNKVRRDFHRLRYGRSFTEVGNRRQILFDKIYPHILDICRNLPDPDNAVVNFEKFVFSYGAGKDLYSLCYFERKLLELLLRLFGNSEFLSQILIKMPELFDALFAFDSLESAKSLKEMTEEIWNESGRLSGDKQIEALVKYVRSQELRIGTRYLTGKTDASFGELTGLAEAYLQRIFEICYRQLESRYGTPSFSGARSRKSHFAVIGFGKLGGREIDFGSDLDIMFIYEADGETFSGNGQTRSIDNRSFFTKLSQLMVKSIKKYTRFGFSYQVDLDIRPEGKQGNLAVTLDQLKAYYEKRALVWEFQALLKARPAAGDNQIFFDSFNRMRELVLTRNRFSQENISLQIEEMLVKIRQERASKQVELKDLKLGAGGVIEIEFLVQELQLKFGREKPQLYSANTLEALELLRESGLINEGQYRSLKNAYSFLREIISRERLIKGKSCNTISCAPDQLEVLAKRLNYTGGINFSPGEVLYNVFLTHTRQVVDICNESYLSFGKKKGNPKKTMN